MPHKFPTPPNTTTMKLSMMYPWPRFGETLSICDSATPAIPPDPRAKPEGQHVDPRGLEMPIDAAMRRFCVTARICRPNGVAPQNELQPDEDERREHNDPKPIGGDRQAPDIRTRSATSCC